MKKSEQSVSVLNDLLILNCETEKLFLYALCQVEDKILKNFFSVAGYERTSFIKSLDASIRENGDVPTYYDVSDINNSMKNSSLIKALKTQDVQLLLNEAGKIQMLDIEKYQKILNNVEFSDTDEELLESQQDIIVKSLYGIEVYKDFYVQQSMPYKAS
ncbi:hypothetical protein ACFSKN_16340 [Mariniflexile gromovii]|uniref:DUF2383 domain-containing protein n=1 Tax=Mariniflexile gromovii TaxID=362523 RepID=A0ABS4BZV7_9FLAO|nr:hypothetical protein [Mariniflexile gromovii]MBP0905697.1 hypothetical protein [Mariniflexile gromovii]